MADLFYMNLGEIRTFCNDHGIPYRICVAAKDGTLRNTKDTDRKSVVLERVRHYLETGEIPPPTAFPERIVRTDGCPEELNPRDRLYYGWYDKKSPVMVGLLQALTDGKFRNGAIARILCREFWSAGKAPTFAEYAKAWLRENEKGLGYHPEAAWLTDRARGEAGGDWKKKRVERAQRAMKVLAKIPK